MNVINVTPEMRVLALGRLGENEVTQFVFDVSDWLEEFPGATIGLAHHLPHSSDSYPCAIVSEGDGKYSWTITSAELTVEGEGECEMLCVKDSAVKMGKIYTTKIGKSLDPDADPPEEWEGYITQVTGLKEDTEDAAEDAEAYAVGKRGGTDVESTDPAYHNNSKYYAEQAGSSATSAAGSATTAGNKASDAEAYAVGKRGGVDVESGDAAYHNNSKYYSEQAAGSATAAAASAAQAVNKANRAAIAKEYADLTYPVAKGTWCWKENVLYEANQTISTSEEWTAAHWTQTTIEAEHCALKTEINNKVDEPETEGTDGQVLTTDGNGGRSWTDKPTVPAIATSAQIKAGTDSTHPIAPNRQNESVFYALAKLAGADMASLSGETVGVYPDAQKVAIQKMLGIYEAPWELIREDTINNETAANEEVTVDGDGNAFELTDVIVYFVLGSDNAAASYGNYGIIRYYYESNKYDETMSNPFSTTAGQYKIIISFIEQQKGMVKKTAILNAVNGGNGTLIRYANKNYESSITAVEVFSGERVYSKVTFFNVLGKASYRIYGRRKWTA